MNERKTAAKILYDVEYGGAYSNIALSKAFKNGNFSSEEKGLISELVYGVTEKRITLDYIISLFSKIKINKISPNILNALRLGVYQILYTEKIPLSAAVNESVKLAKAFGGQRSGGFANGVLRSFIREKDKIKFPDEPNKRLSVLYSFPQELTDFFIDEYGAEFTEKLFETFSKKSPITLRCNLMKSNTHSLVDELILHGANAEVYENEYFPSLDYAVSVGGLKNIDTLPSYANGNFYVQDIAAMLVCDVLNPKSGDTVIDMCAAPGGKATHIAEKMNNCGKIFAFDIYEHKIRLINENAARLGVDICEAVINDATVKNSKYVNTADCVLADVPCSGLGIIGKKPDIKYHRSVSDIEELADIGLKILKNGAEYVKPGGTLVYSTCTLSRKENEENVKRFLDDYGDEFYLEPIREVAETNTGFITLFPHIHGTDGFFICKFRKNNGEEND